jgi:hypothetical protein
MLFRFYCDESYDGNSLRPDALTISGFFSDEETWAEIERQWNSVNARYSVECFHATALNHGKEEYQGWPMAMEFFEKLAKNTNFPYRHRLRACTAATPQKAAGLQVADLMAYEYFRRLHRAGQEMRKPLELIRKSSNYAEGYFGESTLKSMKADIESAHCGPGELVVIPQLQ